jgi:hypothetical protein
MLHGSMGVGVGLLVMTLFFMRFRSTKRSLALGAIEYGFVSGIIWLAFASRSYQIYQEEIMRMGKRYRLKDPEAFLRYQIANEQELGEYKDNS